ncbi:MAG TPA: ABC transporter permease [Pseudolabrys sp.]|nr:ABC transporter permease [Pseudolabrys sp.]
MTYSASPERADDVRFGGDQQLLSLQLVRSAIANPWLWVTLSWHDIVQSYRRTTLGPLWITMNMLIFAAAMTIVYSAIFGVSPTEYGVFVVTSMTIWWWILGILNEGGTTFIIYGQFIRSMPCDKAVFVWAAAFKQMIILAHHAVIYLLLMVFGMLKPSLYMLLAVPAVFVVFLMTVPMIGLLAILCARYRDLPRLISSATVILMMITPVFWQPSMLSGWRTLLYEFNPLYYLIEVLRRPMLGEPISGLTVSVIVCMFGAIWALGSVFFGRYQRYIVFWL